MKIPKQFILHGHTITIREVEKLESNNYGEYDSTREVITIAHKIKTYDGLVELTRTQIEVTLLHEVMHAIQWHSKGETNEFEAQTYAGLLYEFITTSNIKIDPNIVHTSNVIDDGNNL